MARKLKSIFEIFNEYSENEILQVINNLTDEEKEIIKYRYGDDLHNPKTSENWTSAKNTKFYSCVLPKIKKALLFKHTKNIEAIDMKIQIEPITNEKTKVSDIDEQEKDFSNENNDHTSDLLKLIKENKNNNEICKIMNFTSKQLQQELLNLKNKGFVYSKKYYSDGTIKYVRSTCFQDLRNYKDLGRARTIISDVNENEMKFLVISDLHFGNDLERIDLLKRCFDYCKNNNINIILCGGDLIDGAKANTTNKEEKIYSQMMNFLNNYPYEENILTFAVGGNHDFCTVCELSLDMIEMCDNNRSDFIIAGYNNAEIKVKNDKIHLYHHMPNGKMLTTDAPIILHGHSHKYTAHVEKDVLNITIPALSKVALPIPSCLELNVEFDKGYINNAIVKNIYFGKNSDMILSEINFDLSNRAIVRTSPINVENYKDKTNKVLQKTIPTSSKNEHRLSQIEKFTKRYGNK